MAQGPDVKRPIAMHNFTKHAMAKNYGCIHLGRIKKSLYISIAYNLMNLRIQQ